MCLPSRSAGTQPPVIGHATLVTRKRSSPWPRRPNSDSLKGWNNGCKVYKPITPGLRGMTGYTFEEITKINARTLADRYSQETCWSQLLRPDHRPPPGRRQPPVYPHGRFQTRTSRHSRPKLRRSNMIPTAPPAWRCWFMPMARNAISWLRLGLKVGDTHHVRSAGRNSPWQQPADRQHPGWYDDPQHRAAKRARAVSWFAQPVLQPNCWPKKAIMPRSACLLVKYA